MRNNYGSSAFFLNDPKRANEEFTEEEYKRIFKFRKQIKALESHNLRYPLPNSIDSTGVKPVTFLRNPMERFLSNYFYLQQIAGKMHYSNTDFENFIKYIQENHPKDVRYLNGEVFQIAKSFDLDKAKSIIDEFFMAGVTDMYDETLLLLKQKMGSERFNINYEKKNVGTRKNKLKDQYEEIKNSSLYDYLTELNSLDVELYNYVKNKLQQAVAEQGVAFKDDLQQFKENNKVYQFPYLKNKSANFFSKVKTSFLQDYVSKRNK